jgi:hypothetical protein
LGAFIHDSNKHESPQIDKGAVATPSVFADMVAEEQSANVDEMNVVYNDDSDQNLAFIDRFEYTDEYQVDQILKASKLMKTFTKKALDGKNIGSLRRAYKQHLTAAAKIKRVLAKIGQQISNFDESDSDEVDAVM